MPSEPLRKVALVTGSARRIGASIALGLARTGHAVAIHHRQSAADAEALARRIRELGVGVAVLAEDIAEPVGCARLVERCAAALGAPTCLVNNASLFEHDLLTDLTATRFDEHVAVNLRAPLLLAQAFAARLPSSAEGNIVNIVDQRVLKPTPAFFSYSLTKSALWQATLMMAQALAPRIRVNAIGPGPVLKSVHQSDAEFAAEQRATLLGRGTSPDEIAAAVRFILDAPAMTGQMIVLDGGQHLTWDFEQAPSGGAPPVSADNHNRRG